MQNSRLSIELCELVIDFIQEPGPWWDLTWWMLQNDPAILVKYTCICSAWLPRARRVLYHTIKFRKPSQVDLFIRSITENPSLANAVRDLIITPKGERTYIPFVHHTLVTRLRRLRTLVFYFDRGQKWVFPPRHHELVAMLPVTNLVIMYPSDDHHVWSGVFRLIYSLRNLQALHIDGPTSYGKPRFDTTRRPSWVCSKLRTLVLTGASQIDNLPKRAMGNVKQLALYNFDLAKLYTTDTHWESISLFSSLEELFMLCYAKIPPGEGRSIVSAYIVPLLEHLPPQDALRTVIIQIYSRQDDSRGRFLRELSSQKVDELLNKFTKLESLCFWLEESRASGYDAERWRSLLYEHLPKLRGNVTISVKFEWRSFIPWDDDLDQDDDSEAPTEENDLDIGDNSAERSHLDEVGDLFEDDKPHVDSGSSLYSESNDEVNDEASVEGGTTACVEAST